jgi:RecB family exonuclease
MIVCHTKNMASKKIQLPVLNNSVEQTTINFNDLLSGKSISVNSSDIILNEKRTHDKESVSYSEIVTHMECSYRHYLKYIEKIELDEPTEHTEFGQVIHKILETYLKERKMLSVDEAKIQLTEAFSKLKNFESLQEKDWHDSIEPILKDAAKFLDEKFPGWVFVDSEAELYEPIEGTNKKFKGYIDAIIKTPKKRGQGWNYHILDWKTTSWGWKPEKKTDFKKIIQLAFYKIFWSNKTNIPLKDIKTAFILLKRNVKKEHCELVPVYVGKKTIEKAMEALYFFLASIKQNLTRKNRDVCDYCVYYKTPHCQ